MEMQPKVYVVNWTFIVNQEQQMYAEIFMDSLKKLEEDFAETDDDTVEFYGVEVLNPSMDLISSSSLALSFIVKDKPDHKDFIRIVAKSFCITSSIMDFESKDDGGLLMWFGGDVLKYELNRYYFILKKIDALRITDAPESFEELALMVDEPAKVIERLLEVMEVTLQDLPSTNFRPNIRDNDYFKKVD